MTNKIVDSIQFSLQSRQLGATAFKSGNANLDHVLSLQFRVYYHALGDGLTTSVATVLLDQCLKLNTIFNESVITVENRDFEVQELAHLTLYNLLGILYYHTNDVVNAKKFLNKMLNVTFSKQIVSHNEDFITLLRLENLYYRGLLLTRDEGTSLYYTELLKILNKIPQTSEGQLHQYLYLISEFLTQNGKIKPSHILKSFKVTNPLTCLLSILSLDKLSEQDLDLNGIDGMFLSLGNKVLQNSKFPNANEINNPQLKQVHFFLQYYFKNCFHKNSSMGKEDKNKWHRFIIDSMGKTFRSTIVSKTAMIFFNLIDSRREAILNFVNIIKYTEKERELNHGIYKNIVSFIDSYAIILSSCSKSNDIEGIFNFQKTTTQLHNLLILFYKDYQFPLQQQQPLSNDIQMSTSTKLHLPKNVTTTLLQAWNTLYNCGKSNLPDIISGKLSEYLLNAMSLHTTNKQETVNLQFQFAYNLAQQNRIEQCITFLEDELLLSNQFCYKAWHLLALCYSTQEDKEKSYKIVNSALNAMLEVNDTPQEWSWKERWQLIQLKLTQLQLVEEIFGTVEALQMLEELFDLYNDLFDDSNELVIQQEAAIRKNILLRKEFLLQMIWLFAGNLYMKLGGEDGLKETSDAINEAKKIGKEFNNLNASILTGYMYMNRGESKKALKEFEKVLYYDDSNVEALIGFAGLVFPENLTDEEQDLEKYYKFNILPMNEDLEESTSESTTTPTIQTTQELIPKHSVSESIFVNEIDESAGIARLKFLLECSIMNSLEAYHSPDIWWYLALILSLIHI